jgi:hypothetical protein
MDSRLKLIEELNEAIDLLSPLMLPKGKDKGVQTTIRLFGKEDNAYGST